MATIMVLSDISTAPAAAGNTMPHGAQHAGGERDRNDVVPRGPPQVLDHLPVCRLAQREDPRHVARIASHEDDITGLDGDIRPGANRDPHVSRHERRCIVDTVPHHRHALPLPLDLLNLRRFLVGQDFGEDRIDAQLGCHGIRDCLRIAGHHDDFHLLLVQTPNSLAGLVPDRVGDGEHRVRCTSFEHPDCGLPAGGCPIYCGLEFWIDLRSP